MKPVKGLSVAAVWMAALMLVVGPGDGALTQPAPTEAPTGFVGSNGFDTEFCADQGALAEINDLSPAIDEDECNFDAAAEEFTGPETSADGLGPIFNAAGCGECHSANPGLGATSQIVERRAARFVNGVYTDHPGGSLIQDRTLLGSIAFQERVLPGHNVIALRNTISTFGDGFVEALANETLQGIANAQPASQRGQIIQVPVLERPGQTRFGRFGHKDQQASLLSFSADAYLNEMGITSPMQPDENTSHGRTVPKPPEAPVGLDDEGVDVALFALFMRSLNAPPIDAAIANTGDARTGRAIFDQINCDTCHTPAMVTSRPGTLINGGGMRVANALGNKIIRPYGDFLLHDVGTGDGIIQNGGPATRNKVRTAPLWGLRAKGRFMHDNLSNSVEDAIRRHRNQAEASRAAFDRLSTRSKGQVLTFLSSL